MNKSVIYIGASVGGVAGGWLGSLIDHSMFGLWGIILSVVGGLVGIYAAVKIQQ
jgi:hypothetical protein